VGGLRPEKNLELLLRGFAAAKLPDARLALVGEGACRGRLERVAQELGIGPKVIFEGQVADTAPCLAAFDVFVMSSITEQTPNALLEAMACGLPAVATDVGDTGDILAQCGWPAVVQPDDLQGYAARLREMAGSAQLREAVGSANRRRVLSDYSFERMVREYAELYFSAAGRSPVAPLETPCPTAGH
jgi:glycosyltransferase involved in cell wall biosynthesis